jgi:hypothetical protein
MTLSFEDIEYMNANLESQVFDRKSIGILSHPNDLAGLMVAFGNNKFVSEDFGGIIVIGIDDNGEFEKLEPKQGHEEKIMNVAQQNIYPPMTPTFEVLSDETRNVYAITIPKMTSTPYGLKTSEGIVYKKRVGSTVRDALYDEIKLLEKESDDSKSKEERIETNFPRSTDKPIIRITIIPIDANRQVIDFDKNQSEWLKSNSPKFHSIRKITLKQNEMHYESQTVPSPESQWIVVNQFGEISSIEFIQIYQGNTVHVGRQTAVLLSILHFANDIYKKFRYVNRISVKVELDNVINYEFKGTDLDDPLFHTGKEFVINPIPIKRIISLDSLNIDSLATSIMVEVCRACDWIIDDTEFHKYVKWLETKGVKF